MFENGGPIRFTQVNEVVDHAKILREQNRVQSELVKTLLTLAENGSDASCRARVVEVLASQFGSVAHDMVFRYPRYAGEVMGSLLVFSELMTRFYNGAQAVPEHLLDRVKSLLARPRGLP